MSFEVSWTNKLLGVILATMARRTKKEKILADLRKKSKLLSPPSREMSSNLTLQQISTSNLHTLPSTNQIESLYIYPIQLIRKDLTKTLLLSILAISLEIALFLLLEKH